MKILIIGANGQLGTEIAKCFKEKHTELGIPDILKQENEVVLKDKDTLDITNFEEVDKYISKEKFDAVINCAAFTNVNACEKEKELAFAVNTLGPKNLAIACEKIDAKLVHISTDYVFAGDATTPYLEYDICNPQNVYGKTKYLGEEFVKGFSSKYFIVRTSWLYGYYGKNFVKTIMNIAKEKGVCEVVDDQRGNPTNCADLAHHILKLLTTENYGIYHGTGNGECSWFEFAQKIVEYAKINAVVNPCSSDKFPSPVVRPKYSSLSNTHFKCTTGDEFRDWQMALKSFFENYEKIGE